MRKHYGIQVPKGYFEESIDMKSLMHNELVNAKWADTLRYYDYDEILENAKLNQREDEEEVVRVERSPYRMLDGTVYKG